MIPIGKYDGEPPPDDIPFRDGESDCALSGLQHSCSPDAEMPGDTQSERRHSPVGKAPSINQKIAAEIRVEQDHGRSKYGKGPDDFAHDDSHAPEEWHEYIADHNERAALSTPLERRQHLVKVAGLAISAIEAFDRSRPSERSERRANGARLLPPTEE